VNSKRFCNPAAEQKNFKRQDVQEKEKNVVDRKIGKKIKEEKQTIVLRSSLALICSVRAQCACTFLVDAPAIFSHLTSIFFAF